LSNLKKVRPRRPSSTSHLTEAKSAKPTQAAGRSATSYKKGFETPEVMIFVILAYIVGMVVGGSIGRKISR
jgi:hypothetical protein